jgi:hypothetical protein
MDLIENKNFLTDEELEEIKVLETGKFPWYFETSGYTNIDNPFFSHNIITRYPKNEFPVINSDYYGFYNNIFGRFCENNDIKYKRILRMNLNFSYHFDSEYYSKPHVDHDFPHKILLMYLNESSGNTVLFNDDKLSIQKEISPELGKVVSFDGMTYHGVRPCKINTHRIVCVVTYN